MYKIDCYVEHTNSSYHGISYEYALNDEIALAEYKKGKNPFCIVLMQITIASDNKVYNYECLQDPGYDFREIKNLIENFTLQTLLQDSIHKIKLNMYVKSPDLTYDVNLAELFYDVGCKHLMYMLGCAFEFIDEYYSCNAIQFLINDSFLTRQMYLRILCRLATKENFEFKNAQKCCKSADDQKVKIKICSDYEHAKNMFLTKWCIDNMHISFNICYGEEFLDAIATLYETTFSYEEFKKLIKSIHTRFLRTLFQKYKNCLNEKQTFYSQTHDFSGTNKEIEATIHSANLEVYCN